MDPRLLLLADGRFPSGGHANSSGGESAVNHGDVVDATSLEAHLRGRLATSGTTDAAFAAWACAHGDRPTGDWLADLDAEYGARTASPRLGEVSRQLGRQLCRSARAIWPHPGLDDAAAVASGCYQPIVLGLAVAAAGGTTRDAASLVVHHLSASITTAAVRMLGLDPVEAVAAQARVAADLDPLLDDAADRWPTLPVADLPARTGTLTEILAEAHGRADRRLFVA